jgi:hypothetical protein
LTFGQAVEALKAGRTVTRAGWNSGMSLVLTKPGAGESFARVDMTTAQGNVPPWQCSHTDMLAEDWQEVPASK